MIRTILIVPVAEPAELAGRSVERNKHWQKEVCMVSPHRIGKRPISKVCSSHYQQTRPLGLSKQRGRKVSGKPSQKNRRIEAQKKRKSGTGRGEWRRRKERKGRRQRNRKGKNKPVDGERRFIVGVARHYTMIFCAQIKLNKSRCQVAMPPCTMRLRILRNRVKSLQSCDAFVQVLKDGMALLDCRFRQDEISVLAYPIGTIWSTNDGLTVLTALSRAIT